ncbi:uncharacterized protein BP01DRAFT_390601 [Aspergillus saccharolyticus JOP 1030-1]|uniref:Uncharacterized protein n=1 Tax=Aspergillus saccharolyticus JOP 1030-1 TaxID=1450539 RepID=A0A319A481_9EURO|nr:hypothetical protein BP01DRAFT_390601 [Aspergillus saccharolyticus JOP 1030-1]PYH46938.1 hypothetical protein BP01DRAFT_390601 [Aspergillus saccharolyticus JOP 1030-1]
MPIATSSLTRLDRPTRILQHNDDAYLTLLASALKAAARQPNRFGSPVILTPASSSSTTTTTNTTRSITGLDLYHATLSDAPQPTDVFLNSFSGPFNHRLFLPTDDVRTWWIEKFIVTSRRPDSLLLAAQS